MAAKKYIKLDDSNKNMAEESAVETSTGASDEGKIVALNTSGKIDDTMMPAGIGAETVVAPASEALTANDIVNLFDDSGTIKARKADATDATKPAHGYVQADVLSGSNATVYFEGYLPGTGFTVGSVYFLATTAGGNTTTPPSSSGNVWQSVGVAVSTSEIDFNPENPIVRA